MTSPLEIQKALYEEPNIRSCENGLDICTWMREDKSRSKTFLEYKSLCGRLEMKVLSHIIYAIYVLS